MLSNPDAEGAWERKTRTISIATAAMFVAYTAWYLVSHSHFHADDLDWFILEQKTGFWQFIATPVIDHYSPGHRLLTWLVFNLAPMNFSAAVFVLTAFHAGSLVYLALLMRLLKVGQAGGLVVCGFAASILVIYGFIWWANAEHRVPYVFLDLCAIYHYLVWLREARRKHLIMAVLAFVFAFGFYEKAVLIPLHMLVIGYLSDEKRFRADLLRSVRVPILLSLISTAYVITYLLLKPSSVSVPLSLTLRVDLEFLKVLSVGAFGLATENPTFSNTQQFDVPIHGFNTRLIGLALVVFIMIVVSFWRNRGSWKPLVAMFALPFLDNIPISASGMAFFWEVSKTHEYRFTYEELHLFALTLGLWISRIAMPARLLPGRKFVWAAGYGLVICYASLGWWRIQQQLHMQSTLWGAEKSRIYHLNLCQGLGEIREPAPAFEVNKLPHYPGGLFGHAPDTRSIVPLYMPTVRFDNTAHPRYTVKSDGHVELVQ